MHTGAMVAYGQESIAGWVTLTGIFDHLDEDEPLLAMVAAPAYILGDLERSSTNQWKADKI